MRRVYFFLAALLLLFLAIQFIRPEKNLGEIENPSAFILVSQVPDTLARIFMNSCYDCHSDRTNYPWYGNIAPISWILNKHIKEGKKHMNFSEYGLLDRLGKIALLNDVCDECSDGGMPLKSYLYIHRSAALSAHELEAICSWTETEAMGIMNSKE